MANLPFASIIFLTLKISLGIASTNQDVVYYFPLNSTTISGTIKNGSCFDLRAITIHGSSHSTTEGPDASLSDPAVSLASDTWINLGDFSNTCISNPALCLNGMTVTFWIRLDVSGAGDRHIINTGRMDTSRGIQVFYTNSHTNIVLCDGAKRYPSEIDFPSYWTHVVAVYSPTGATAADKFYVYVNATTKETASYEANCALADTETNLLIGHDNSGALSGGRQLDLSQLTFFFRTLNQTEIQQIYSNPSSGIQLNCPPPTSPPTFTTPTTSGATTGGATATGGATTTSGATTGAAVSNTNTASGTTSTSPASGTPSSGSRSDLSQGQQSDGESRSPTVLILLSVALFVLLSVGIPLLNNIKRQAGISLMHATLYASWRFLAFLLFSFSVLILGHPLNYSYKPLSRSQLDFECVDLVLFRARNLNQENSFSQLCFHPK